MLTAPRPCRGRLVTSLYMVATGRVIAAVAGSYLTCSTDPKAATASPVTHGLYHVFSPNSTLIRSC